MRSKPTWVVSITAPQVKPAHRNYFKAVVETGSAGTAVRIALGRAKKEAWKGKRLTEYRIGVARAVKVVDTQQ